MSVENLPPLNATIPPDHHPSMLKSRNISLINAGSRGYSVWAALKNTERELDEHARGTRPPVPQRKLTQEDHAKLNAWQNQTSQHKAKLAEEAIPKIKSALATMDKAIASATGHAKSIEAKIQSTIVPRPATTPYDIEIRQMVKAAKMPFDFAHTAIRNGQLDVAVAVLGTLPAMSGLDDNQHATLRQAAVKAFAEEDGNQLAALQRDIQRVETARDEFLKFTSTTIGKWQSEERNIITEGLANA